MTPDSWAYWQGSVSLLNGKGYTYFFYDLHLEDWPPLYTAYLAVWQKVLGVSSLTLAAANIALSFFAAFGWSWVMLDLRRRIQRDGKKSERRLVDVLIVLSVAILVSQNSCALLSENLKHVLLPILLYASGRTLQASSQRKYFFWIGISAISGLLLMLTHHVCITHVAAVCVGMALLGTAPMSIRATGIALFAGGSVVPWFIICKAVGGLGGHSIRWAGGTFTPGQYLHQIVFSSGYLFAPLSTIGGLILLFLLGSIAWHILHTQKTTEDKFVPAAKNVEDSRRTLVYYVTFCLVSFLAIYLVFNISPISNPLAERYLVFEALVLVPIGLICLAEETSLTRTVLVACLVLAFPLRRVAYVVLHPQRIEPSNINATYNQMHYIGLNYTIQRGVIDRKPVLLGNKILVSPPTYPWFKIIMERSRNQQNGK